MECPPYTGQWSSCDWVDTSHPPIPTEPLEAVAIGVGLLFMLSVAILLGAFAAWLDQ